MRLPQIYLILLVFGCFIKTNAQDPILRNTKNGYLFENASGKVLASELIKVEPFVNGVSICKKVKGVGVYNTSVEVVIPFKYASVEFVTNDILKAKSNGRYTLFKLNGKKFTSKYYSDVSRWQSTSSNLTYRTTKGSYGMMDSLGNDVLKPIYSSPPKILTPSLYGIHKSAGKKHLMGVIDQNGKTVVSFKYLFINTYRDNILKCIKDDGSITFYNEEGKHLYTGKDGEIRSINNDFLVLDNDGRQILNHFNTKSTYEADNWILRDDFYYGHSENKTLVVNRVGKLLTKNGSIRFHDINHDLVKVSYKKDNQTFYGLWNKSLNEVLPFEYYSIESFNSKYASVILDKKSRLQSIVDLKTKQIYFKEQFIRVEFLPCGMLEVTDSEKKQLLDSNLLDATDKPSYGDTFYTISDIEYQKLARDFKYKGGGEMNIDSLTNITCSERQVINLPKQQLRLILDRYGKNPINNKIILQYYDEFQKVNKVALIDFRGKLILPSKYVVISSHDNGYIPVGIVHKLDYGSMTLYGLMDKNGNEVIKPAYEKVDRCIDGVVTVMRHGLWSMIDIESKKVLISELSGIRPNEEGFFHISKRGLNGVCDKTGKVIVPILYKNVSYKPNEQGLFTAERDKEKVYIDLEGNEFPRT